MYDVFHHRSLAYLHNLVTFTESDSARSWLRSSTTTSPVTVRTRTKLGSRILHIINCHCTFCWWLKSHLF